MKRRKKPIVYVDFVLFDKEIFSPIFKVKNMKLELFDKSFKFLKRKYE